MSDIDSMRAKLRDMDEEKSELESQWNSLEMKGDSDPQVKNDIRAIDVQINRVDKNMQTLVERISEAAG